MQCSGYRVSNATFNAIVMRYSDKDGHVKFNDFVAAYIKLKTLFGKSFFSPSVISSFKWFRLWQIVGTSGCYIISQILCTFLADHTATQYDRLLAS